MECLGHRACDLSLRMELVQALPAFRVIPPCCRCDMLFLFIEGLICVLLAVVCWYRA
jgi:hypothetical protein